MRIIHTNDDWGWCDQEQQLPHTVGLGETLKRRDGETVERMTCPTCGTYLYTKVTRGGK